MRWHATIHYRTNAVGTVDVEHDLDELEDLHDLVEAGPHWDTIEKIVVLRGETLVPDLTVEKALTL
jgi:hypothetical protein